jgi:tRNA pseudouridine38-40 synthase
VTTYRLTLEYDGTRYRGWQEQKNATTVQGELRRALEAFVGAPVELGGSGRTDAGVHALAQVAHLRVPGELRVEALRREVNERLPPDIHVLAAARAAERFHARHTAAARSYLYQISRRRTAFAKRFVWWVKRDLDLASLTAAAGELVGRHDFAAFCERPQEQTSTLVELERAEVAAAGDLVLVRVVASHFLWKMVRRVVGALAAAGAGDIAPGDVSRLLRAEPVRGFVPAEATAPPSGLFLERVLYPGDAPLGELAPAIAVPRAG